MQRYAATGRRAAAASKTILTIGQPSSGMRRFCLYDIQLSSRDTPVDQALNFDVRRCTALGTSTAVTPTKFDEADAASNSVAGENHTVEPTYTSATELIDQDFNLKTTYRWVTDPEYGFVIPATASNGLGVEILGISSGTPNVESTVHFQE